MPYKLRLKIGGICGIVKSGNGFEVWMVDATDPNVLRVRPSLKKYISSHRARISFYGNDGEIKYTNISKLDPAFVCGDPKEWVAFDIGGYTGTLRIGDSDKEPMGLDGLQMLSLHSIARGAGGSADRGYTTSIIAVALGATAEVSVYPWPFPVKFHYRSGGYVVPRFVVVEVADCTAPVTLSLWKVGGGTATLEASGLDKGVLELSLRNEDVASAAGETCSSGADFAAHYHVLELPHLSDCAYPEKFLGGGAGDDAQCSPIEYKP